MSPTSTCGAEGHPKFRARNGTARYGFALLLSTMGGRAGLDFTGLDARNFDSCALAFPHLNRAYEEGQISINISTEQPV